MKAQITKVEPTEDGQHVLVSYDIKVVDDVVTSGDLTVGITAEAEHVEEMLASRVRTFAALVALTGKTIE